MMGVLTPGYGLLCKLVYDLLIFLLTLYALYLRVLLLTLGIYSQSPGSQFILGSKVIDTAGSKPTIMLCVKLP